MANKRKSKKQKNKKSLQVLLGILITLFVIGLVSFGFLYSKTIEKGSNVSKGEIENLSEGSKQSEEQEISEEEDTKNYIVILRLNGFEPSVLEIKKADSVTWINENVEKYDVITSLQDQEFKSGRIFVGKNFSHTFNKEGEFSYISAVSERQGKIIVS